MVSGKWDAVLAEGLSWAVASGLGKVRLNVDGHRGFVSKQSMGGQKDSRYKNI